MATQGCCRASSRPRTPGAAAPSRCGAGPGDIRARQSRRSARRAAAPASSSRSMSSTRGDADRPAGAAAPRQFRQRGERAPRPAATRDERAKRARADILRADQPQPIETLVIAEPRFERRLAAIPQLPSCRFWFRFPPAAARCWRCGESTGSPPARQTRSRPSCRPKPARRAARRRWRPAPPPRNSGSRPPSRARPARRRAPAGRAPST